MTARNNMVPIHGTFLNRTDKALFIDVDGEEYSLPISKIEMSDEDYTRGDDIEVRVPQWLIEDREIP